MIYLLPAPYKNQIARSSKVYTTLLATLPILNVYAFTFLTGISIGMMLATLFFLYGIIHLLYFRKLSSGGIVPFLLLIVWIALGSLGYFITGWVSIDFVSYAYNLSKVMVWGIIISVVSAHFFNEKVFINVVYKIAAVATFYIIFQSLLVFLFGMKISNGLDLGFISANYSQYVFEQGIHSEQVRLSSIWFDPNQYANYVLLAMICLLFGEDNFIKKRYYFFLFSLGLILSTSTTAIIWLMILLVFFSMSIGYTGGFIALFFGLISIFVLFNIDTLLDLLQNYGVLGHSLYMSITKLDGWETSARLGASFKAAFSILDYGLYKYVGTGFGSEDTVMKDLNMELLYLNSFSRVFITTGFLGVFSYFLFYFYLIFKFRNSRLPFVLVTYCFIGGFYSTMWTSPDSMLYYSLALYGYKKESLRG